MTKGDRGFLIFRWVFATALIGYLYLALWAGGSSTAWGLCPDGVQMHGTKSWNTLTDSEGMIGEQINLKYDYVANHLYFCEDGTVMGRSEVMRGTSKKGK
jgi:hypothetical protein